MKKLLRLFAQVVIGILVLIVLAIAALNLYQSTRPAAKTMKPAGIVTIPVTLAWGGRSSTT